MEVFILKRFKRSFMFSFHDDSDLDILLEKLTAQIGARLGSGTEICLKGPGVFWVDIIVILQLRSG